MSADRGCVVAATALPSETLCAQLKSIGFSRVVTAGDGLNALRRVRDFLPDALVADAALPVLGGESLPERVRRMPLAIYPAMVLLRLPGMRVGNPGMDCAVLDKPAEADALAMALDALAPERRPVLPEMHGRIGELLGQLGVPRHCGRDYLTRAVEMAWMDSRLLRALTTRLYPSIAIEFGVERRHVERAMRHTIDEAWRSGEMEAQYRLFGDTIDAKRGSPTCGEMIARIADILRWEGKA